MEALNLRAIAVHTLTRYNGFKILYGQIIRTSQFWKQLLRMKDVKIIHMCRHNLLESALSRHVATTSGIWNLTVKQKHPGVSAVTIEKHSLDQYMANHFMNQQYYTAFFNPKKNPNVLQVEYEELYDWDAMSQRIQSFLGVTYTPIESVLTKRTIGKPKDLIVNFKELKKYFAGTLWGRYFH